MSKFEFRLPDIGEGVAEGEIVSWLVEVGDVVAENQELVEVMTDKATVTIGSPKEGRVSELRGEPGSTVPVGQVLAVLEVEGEAEEEAPRPTPAADGEVKASAVGDLKDQLPGVATAAAPPAESGGFARPLAAPATRRLARELGVKLEDIQPSGPEGRITREDVERHAAAGLKAPSPAPPVPASTPEPAAPASPVTMPGERGGEQRVAIRGMRKRIYENMARSSRTVAHFTYVDECEVSQLVALRERLRPVAAAEDVHLTFLPFIVKAAVVALKKHPALNCLVDDTKQEMVLRQYCDIGIGIATASGLIVPVLRRAEQRSLLELGREIERLATAAREGKTRPEDLGGSSFTITSLGKLGGLLATPVVNYPEVAILGVHEIKRRPVVRGDAIVVADVVHLSLSFDHRIIDGHVGAAFAQEIKACLEQPDRLLLG
jgi:pyruvate dehydrogenase E2 component (dihydrolipoamide acetyltransferase)